MYDHYVSIQTLIITLLRNVILTVPKAAWATSNSVSGGTTEQQSARRSRKTEFSNIDFFLKMLPLKDDELVMLKK